MNGKGNVTIAMGDINFPPTTQMTPLGPITVTIIPLSDGSGNLNAVTGASSVTINVRVGLSGSGLPPGCGFNLSTLNLTTGTSGTLTGIAYSQADGTQTLVENVFSADASDGCGGFGPLLDLFIGLPSASGNNSVSNLHSTSNPVFVGS